MASHVHRNRRTSLRLAAWGPEDFLVIGGVVLGLIVCIAVVVFIVFPLAHVGQHLLTEFCGSFCSAVGEVK